VPLSLEANLAVTLGEFSLDLEIAAGASEILALLGPNGSGKTTCLDLIAGLRSPDRGRIVIDGAVVYDSGAAIDRAPEERGVGYVFQDYALFPHCDVRENVAFGLRAKRASRAQRDCVVSEWLSRLDLASLAGRRISELSGGQRQRVAIARALASGARILLLDEPFASLDATVRASVRSTLRAFLREIGLPAIVVTHEALDASVIGDRLAVIEAGRMVQVGTSEHLLAHPRSAFVADLVGINCYEAELAAGSGLKSAQVGPVSFHVVADALAGRVHLAFAPSDVALANDSVSASFQNAFPAHVRETRNLPDRVRVMLDAGVPMAADVTREASVRMNLVSGMKVLAMIKATSIRVYP
jgi:molybdate transport system ATP-binding protein